MVYEMILQQRIFYFVIFSTFYSIFLSSKFDNFLHDISFNISPFCEIKTNSRNG